MRLDDDRKGLGWIAAEDDKVKVTCSDDQGTFKVVFKDKTLGRARTFKGELAWNKARLYAEDRTGRFYYW